MGNQELISIIVPIYQVEKYLDRCIESIVQQTYKNLEIILVDDGSTDSSPFICDAWCEKDPRIKVIHKENGGLSDARNAGLNVANGMFIGFVDSDDWIHNEMYQHLHEKIMEDKADIAACGIKLVFEDGSPSKMLTKSGDYLLNTNDALRALMEETLLKDPVVNKLYRKSVIQDTLFPVGKVHEDVFWSFRIIGAANSVSIIDAPYYYYYQRNGSIMGTSYSLRRLDSLEARAQCVEYISKKYSNLILISKRVLLFSCMYSMQMCLKHLTEEDMMIARNKIVKIVNDHRPYKREKGLPIKKSIWLFAASLDFEGTCRLRNRFGIGY